MIQSLNLTFKFDNNRPIYLQLVEQLQLYVVSGKIPPGEKLPSVRELAMAAQVNPNTMQRALAELESLRLIYTERTNGKFVTNNQRCILRYREEFAHKKARSYFQAMHDLGYEQQAAVDYLINYKGGKK